jgi:hypothetical protein
LINYVYTIFAFCATVRCGLFAFVVVFMLSGHTSTKASDLVNFVLNGKDAGLPYQIYLVDEQGNPVKNDGLIISPSGQGFDAAHVYWPSAVIVNGKIWVYATAVDGNGVRRLGLWKENAAGTFDRHGVVINEAEGSAVVNVDPGDTSAPFKVWYTIKSDPAKAMPDRVRYAMSQDGVAWSNGSQVHAIPAALHGLQLSHVCKDGTDWRMFYTAATISDLSKFSAYQTVATAPDGQFPAPSVVMAPGGESRQILGGMQRGNRLVPVTSVAGYEVGHVYALHNDITNDVQRVTIAKIFPDTNVMLLHEQSTVEGPNQHVRLRSLHWNKVDPSYYYRDASGTGRALMTAWGVYSTGTNEFVFEAAENGAGPFDLAPSPRFMPIGPGNRLSFENPSAVRVGPLCTLDGT